MTIADESTYFVRQDAAELAPAAAAAGAAYHNLQRDESIAKRYLWAPVSGKTDAAGFALLVWPSPPVGFFDTIRNIRVGGPTPVSTAPGEAWPCIVAGSGQSQDVAIALPYTFDFYASMPGGGIYAEDAIVVTPGSSLALQIFDTNTNQDQYLAVARFWRSPINLLGLPDTLGGAPSSAARLAP
jgi:hypothetical protein